MTDFAGYNLVEKRLLRCDSRYADRLLRAYVKGTLAEGYLTYEDLVKPLKTTGGRLSLEVTHPDDAVTYIRYTSPGYLEAVEEGNGGPPTTIPPHQIERWMVTNAHDVTVVPIEDAPFGGGGET